MSIEIRQGDFRELSKELPDDSVDLVLTDPPYPKEFLPLWGDLGAMAKRVLKPSAYLVAYSGHVYLDKVFSMLSEHLEYYTLMVSAEPGAHNKLQARAMFQEWKPVVVYQKPPLKRGDKWGSNVVVSTSPSKEHHIWGQNVKPITELIERFSKPGDLVLDPFLGGGTTAIACQQTGRRCIGYEIDPSAAETARARLAGAQMALFEPYTLERLKHRHVRQSKQNRCLQCDEPFDVFRRDARFCSPGCKQAAYRQRVTLRRNVLLRA